METQSVYDFLNAHVDDAALQIRLRDLENGTDDEYVGTIAQLASERGYDLSEDLIATWLSEAFAEYDTWLTSLDELSEDELDLVSGGSGTTTIGQVQCTGGYQCRVCCPNQKCANCYCPIVGPC